MPQAFVRLRAQRRPSKRRRVVATLGSFAFFLVLTQPLRQPPQIDRLAAQALTIHRDSILRDQPLASALSSMLPTRAIHELVQAARPVYDLSAVMPGRPYGLALLPDGTLQAFTYAIDELRTLRVARRQQRLSATIVQRHYEVRVVTLSRAIDSSLFEAVAALGEGDQLALDFAEIFSWDVDFNTEIQPGDVFHVAIEKLYLDGGFSRYGRILAARLNRGDRILTAVRFDGTGSSGYFAPDGAPLRKAFLRSPLKYARITSRFSRSRYHPILKIVRPHRGIDYAAPAGTAVMATADGTVTSSGWLGGYGKTVRLRHANGYATLYGHLSRINVGAGQRVFQGAVLGAVGRTGTATGPHLDYRMSRNGTYVNPLAAQLPPAAPIPVAERDAFGVARSRCLRLLPAQPSPASLTSMAAVKTAKAAR